MATFNKELLSESINGKAIKVSATAIGTSPTLIHTASTNPNVLDEVWLYAQNNHTADLAVRIGFGGTTDPDDIIEYTVKTKAGLYLIVPGLILKGNATALTIRAACATVDKIFLSGYINRITA
jgi:hypothetical protein